MSNRILSIGAALLGLIAISANGVEARTYQGSGQEAGASDSRPGLSKNFKAKSADYRAWTFTTYVKRALKTMGPLGKPIARQTSNLRRAIHKRLEQDLKRLV